MKTVVIHRIRLSIMQKLINVISLSSGIVSLAIVGSGIYVYVQKDQLIDTAKSAALEIMAESFGDLTNLDNELPLGANDVPSNKLSNF